MIRATDFRGKFLCYFQKVAMLLIIVCMLFVLSLNVPSPSAAEEPRPEPTAEDLLAQRYGAFLRTFVRVASYDWQASLDMTALPEVERQWKTQCGELFSTSDESITFFSHSFLLVSGQDAERWTGGIYNLWLDHWLLLDFIWQKDLLEYRLVGYSWLSGDSTSDLSTVIESTALQDQIISRFTSAVATGLATAAEPQRFGIPEAGPNVQVPAQTVSRRIRKYNDRMISAFVPENDQVQSTLLNAVMELVTQVESGALLEASSLPDLEKTWRESLFPVHVSQKGSQALVILSSAEVPYRMLMAEYDTAGRTPVLRGLKVLALRATPEER